MKFGNKVTRSKCEEGEKERQSISGVDGGEGGEESAACVVVEGTVKQYVLDGKSTLTKGVNGVGGVALVAHEVVAGRSNEIDQYGGDLR